METSENLQPNSHGTIMIEVIYLDQNKQEVFMNDIVAVEKLNYVYDEEASDGATLTIRSTDPLIVDHPAFQTNSQLNVIWGFRGGKITKRKVWVKDTKEDYTKDGVTLTLSCSDKALTLSQNKTDGVYKGSNFFTMADDIGRKNGLKVKIQRPPSFRDLRPEKGETIEEFNRRRDRIAGNDTGDRLDKAIKESYEASGAADYFRKKYKDRQYPDLVDRDLLVYSGKDPVTGLDVVDPEATQQARGNVMATDQLLIEGFLIDMLGSKEALEQSVNEMRDRAGGRRTEKLLLKEQGMKIPGENGGWMAESRDDELRLKKRDYTQAPRRAYTWRGGNGELLSFTPETKNLSEGGKAISNVVSAWNDSLKTFQAQINTLQRQQANQSLALWLDNVAGIPTELAIQSFKSKQVQRGLFNRIWNDPIGPGVISKKEEVTDPVTGMKTTKWVPLEGYTGELGKRNKETLNNLGLGWLYEFGEALSDGTAERMNEIDRTYTPTTGAAIIQLINEGKLSDTDKLFDQYVSKETGGPVSKGYIDEATGGRYKGFKDIPKEVLDQLGIRKQSLYVADILNGLDNPEALMNGNMYHDPLGMNDAMGIGDSSAGQVANEKNPAIALVVGDPDIECGHVETILGVAVKNSGNYYVVKSTHTVEVGTGYTTSMEMVRNGQNIKHNTYQESVKQSNRAINVEMGVDRKSQRLKQIRVEQNKRK